MSRRPGRKCGTVSGYRGGCRCTECLEAKKLSMREYVKRVHERDGLTPTQKLRGVPAPVACTGCSAEIYRTRSMSPRCTACRARDCRSVSMSQDKRHEIYDRDGWICQFCADPVQPGLPANSPWAATLDHVVPRSLGGSDDPGNLRLLHRYCNSVRSNNPALTLDELAS